MRWTRPVVAIAFLAAVFASPAAIAQQVPQGGAAPPPASLPESQIAAGLREALTVAARNAVTRTGHTDGFFKNDAIKILMPARLRGVETALRAVGYGPKVDEFILAMNRAAERAAASATPIFVNAIRSITIEDARQILTGGETAATQYFRTRTQDALATAFRPIVKQATNEVGVTRQYKDLIQSLPLGDVQGLDIDEYVVGKTLDGLFSVMGAEEKKIRQDPAARVTAILRDVFGGSR